MRILCVCHEGNSRSPTIASLLRYRGHETLAVGVNTSTPETRAMLADWCDQAVLTDPAQAAAFPGLPPNKTRLWAIADQYPRPFNPELRRIVLDHAAREGL